MSGKSKGGSKGIVGTKRKTKRVPLSPKALDALEEQRKAFVAKFGREPGPDDPVFFDPDAATPQPFNPESLEKQTVEVMQNAGIPAELIYAFQKTGRLVTEENAKLLEPEELAEWDEAIAEFRSKH